MEIIHKEYINRAKTYNEAAIRRFIIDPILTKLGYPDPNLENTYLEVEEKLEFPYKYSIGRKSKKDLPIGFPDYRAGLKGRRGSFIVEAKAGNIPIDINAIEQAHSYAAHSRVGANYFFICNGEEIKLYETLSGHGANPIVEIKLQEIEDKFYLLENILSPNNLAKICSIEYDKDLKLFEGGKSNIRILSGIYKLDDYNYSIFLNGEENTEAIKRVNPQFLQMERELNLLRDTMDLIISGGFIKRDDSGKIYSDIKFRGITRGNENSMRILNINEMKFTTSEKFISTDKDNRTVFETNKDFNLIKGTELNNMHQGSRIIESNMRSSTFIKSDLYVENNKVIGNYVCFIKNKVRLSPFHLISVEVNMFGILEIDLDL